MLTSEPAQPTGTGLVGMSTGYEAISAREWDVERGGLGTATRSWSGWWSSHTDGVYGRGTRGESR